MKKNFEYYQNVVKKCCLLQNKQIINFTESELRNNLSLVDECIDIILDEFMENGLREDYEPNEYGFELEDAKDYFVRIRISIVG